MRNHGCAGVIKNADHADQMAGYAYKAGDTGSALDYLSIARALAPERAELWDEHERRVRQMGQPRTAPDADPGAAPDGPVRGKARRYGPDEELPADVCPGCRSARLVSAREQCQACGVAAATPRPPVPDLPGVDLYRRDAEAGS
jgi:hypothetical protein